MAPENCSQCRSTGPCERSWARSLVRQSFWSTRIDSPSDHHERRVAAGPVGDRRSRCGSRSSDPGCDLDLLGVDRADELGEPEVGQRALVARVSDSPGSRIGMSRRRWARSHGSSWWSPWRCETYRKSARSIRSSEVVAQLVVAREREPRPEERGHEPGIAQDRTRRGLDEHAGVADRGRPHQTANLKRLGSGTERFRCAVRRPADR